MNLISKQILRSLFASKFALTAVVGGTLLFQATSLHAQVPQKFNYQGIARDAKGNPLANKQLGLKISVLPTQDAAQAEYEETQVVTTNEFGLYTLQIGNGAALTGSMKTVKWETGNKYISVGIDPNGGTNYVTAGTTQLLSVPYAIYSDMAGTAGNTGNSTRATNNFIEKTNGSGVANSTSQLYDNGTNIGFGTTTPSAKFHISNTVAAVQEHLRMQNLSTTGAGRFTMYNDGASSYATFTKYGTTYAGGYAGVSALYPYANLLAFGNNGLAAGDGNGRFLISTAGNAGISLFKSGTSKLKFHADFTTENVGIGGNSTPVARLHANNTDGTTMDLRLTNNTTGHAATDGMEVKNVGTLASVINKENDALVFGTNNAEKMRITSGGVLLSGSSVDFGNFWYRANFYQPSAGQGSAIYLQTTDAGNAGTDGAQISLTSGTTPSLDIANREAGGISFLTSSYTNRMQILDNGNVGIGTITPSAELHVKGSQETIRMEGSNSWIGMADDASSYNSWIWNNAGDNRIELGSLARDYRITPGGSAGMQLNVDGSIGMGTFTTVDPVTIKGNVSGAIANMGIRQDNSSFQYPGLRLIHEGTNNGVALFGGGAQALVVADTTGSFYAPVLASAFTVSSDRTLKKEINTLTSKDYNTYLNQIRNIESATYRYNWENTENRQYPHVGFISQTLPKEVQFMMKEKPSDKTSNDKIGYNLSDMAGLTLLGIKAVDQKNTELETLVQQQQQRLDAQALLIEKLATEVEKLKNK
jgi:hypothetical protein